MRFNRYSVVSFVVLCLLVLSYTKQADGGQAKEVSEAVCCADEKDAASYRVRDLYADANTIRKVYVKTTAYSNDDLSINKPIWRDKRTATNKPVKRGMVAADWRVFPPGTVLYIPGYGEAVVRPSGGPGSPTHGALKPPAETMDHKPFPNTSWSGAQRCSGRCAG